MFLFNNSNKICTNSCWAPQEYKNWPFRLRVFNTNYEAKQILMHRKSCLIPIMEMNFGLHVWTFSNLIYEPRHDKTNKVTVHPAKTQISLGIRPVWPEPSLTPWGKLGSLATHWVHSEDSDETRWMPRQMSLRWAHSHFVGFVMSQLICHYTFLSCQMIC